MVRADLGGLLGTRCPAPHGHLAPQPEASGRLYSCFNPTPTGLRP